MLRVEVSRRREWVMDRKIVQRDIERRHELVVHLMSQRDLFMFFDLRLILLLLLLLFILNFLLRSSWLDI